MAVSWMRSSCRKAAYFVSLSLASACCHAASQEIGLSLTGLVGINNERHAALYIPETAGTKWVTIGDTVERFTVTAIREDSVLLRDADGEETEIFLHESKVTQPTTEEELLADRQRVAWINSRNNPMLFTPDALPRGVIEQWARMAPEDRASIHTWYLSHGWKLQVLMSGDDVVEFGLENIFEEMRETIVRKRHHDFVATLSQEQRDRFTEISRPMPVTPEVKAKWDTFRSSLSEQQRDRLRRIHDFTEEFDESR